MERNAAALNEALELLFFGFRGVTAEPDRILAERGLSRVHHRILYFVGRNPGIAPGGLLRIFEVSKQALNRPLQQLIRLGLVAAVVPAANRRTKELRLTPAGARLERRLSEGQRRRFAAVFRDAGPAAARGWGEIMSRLACAPAPPPRRDPAPRPGRSPSDGVTRSAPTRPRRLPPGRDRGRARPARRSTSTARPPRRGR